MGSEPRLPSVACDLSDSLCRCALFSIPSGSSVEMALECCPLTLLAGVGKEVFDVIVGCCEACVDMGADDGGDENEADCGAVWLGDDCDVKLEAWS